MARSHTFKVGLLVIAAMGILIATVVLVTGIRLAEQVDRYAIRFDESVSGLEQGSAVKYRGVRVGAVKEMSIPEDDISVVEVWIGVKQGTPIMTNTKAKLSAVGITGIMYVELIADKSVEPAEPLPPGSRIDSEVSVLEALTGRATSAAEKADLLLDNLLVISNQQEFDRLKTRAGELRRSLLENSSRLNTLLEVSTSAVTRMDSVLARSNRMLADNQGHIDRSLADLEGGLQEMHTLLAGLNESHMVDNVNGTFTATRDVMGDVRNLVRSNRRTISETLANLRETSANMNAFSRLVREKPSLLVRSGTPEPRRLPGSD